MAERQGGAPGGWLGYGSGTACIWLGYRNVSWPESGANTNTQGGGATWNC